MLKRRRRSSISRASSRSSASSSSIVRSALRVTRNVATSSITIPENSVGRWAMISSSAGTKRDSSTSNEAGEHRRHLDPGEAPVVDLGIGVGDHRGDAERELGDVRERVAGIDGERRQHREDALLVDLGHPLAVDGVEVVPADDGDAGGGQLGHQLVEEHLLLAGDELVGPHVDLGQLLARRAPVGRRLLDAGRDLVLQRGDAHLEELVEVRRRDGAELGPLEQRDPLLAWPAAARGRRTPASSAHD